MNNNTCCDECKKLFDNEETRINLIKMVPINLKLGKASTKTIGSYHEKCFKKMFKGMLRNGN